MTRPDGEDDGSGTAATRGGRALRELRAERLLTVRDLARAVGVHPSTIRALEAGRTARPRPALMRAIAAALAAASEATAEVWGHDPAPCDTTSRAATRVLVVDDAAGIRLLLARLLEEAGYATRTVANGGEALELLSSWPADLILLDLTMPVMDGRAFCREAQRRPFVAAIPIVIVSSEAASEADCAPCRPAACVSKPFSPRALLDIIRAVLGHPRPPPAMAADDPRRASLRPLAT